MRVDIKKGRNGEPITYFPSGKVFLFDRFSNKKPEIGEEWEVEIKFEKERFGVLQPKRRIETEGNFFDKEKKTFIKEVRSGSKVLRSEVLPTEVSFVRFVEKESTCDVDGSVLCYVEASFSHKEREEKVLLYKKEEVIEFFGKERWEEFKQWKEARKEEYDRKRAEKTIQVLEKIKMRIMNGESPKWEGTARFLLLGKIYDIKGIVVEGQFWEIRYESTGFGFQNEIYTYGFNSFEKTEMKVKGRSEFWEKNLQDRKETALKEFREKGKVVLLDKFSLSEEITDRNTIEEWFKKEERENREREEKLSFIPDFIVV